jgi:hypothetical protein
MQMARCALPLLVGLYAVCMPAHAATETEQAMVGAWEISNAARDKICPVNFTVEQATKGLKIELDAACGAIFPSMKDIATWAVGPMDSVQLMDSKGAVVLDFAEVESHMYEAERKGEGLYFMRTQAAVKAETISPEQLFGEWTLLQEFEKPLCKLTLTNAPSEGESFKLSVKPGCAAMIANFGLATWRLAENELLLTGRTGTWRFSESDASIWERVPPSTDPMLLMRQ